MAVIDVERISNPKQGTIREFCGAFRPFFALAGWRFLALPFLFLVAGIFDGIGIVLFFPLLEQLQIGAEPFGRGPLAAFAGILARLHLLSLHGLLLVLVAVFLLKFCVMLGQSIAIAVIARDLHRLLADRLLTGIGRADYAKLYLRTSTGYVANALTRELQVFIAAFTHYAGLLAGCALVLPRPTDVRLIGLGGPAEAFGDVSGHHLAEVRCHRAGLELPEPRRTHHRSASPVVEERVDRCAPPFSSEPKRWDRIAVVR